MTKFYIDQHGCAKNQVDGEILISHLEKAGYVQVSDVELADVIIVNSCGFIESAKKESLNSVYSYKEEFPEKKILLAGCLAERYADLFKTELPEVDGIFGNGDLSLVTQAVENLKGKTKSVIRPEQKGISCATRKSFMNFKNSAYVKITEGCSNHCTFCAIPLIRGEVRSRKASDIIKEIKALLKKGVFEINLIGQDLAAYGTGVSDKVLSDDGNGKSYLAQLLQMISELEGKFWIRLLYIHPDHFNADILEVMKADPRILPYFDIPFQSGDEQIIKAMNRKGPPSKYAKVISTIRSSFKSSSIRTTFLTGFPGETDEQAANTLAFLKKIKSDWSGCFTYSREDDTPAYKMKGRVSKKVSQARADILQATQEELTAKSLKARIGKEYDVLIEEVIPGEDGLAIGRAWFQAPEVDGAVVVHYENDEKDQVKAVVPGAVVRVKATAVAGVDIDSYYIGK